MTTSTAPDYDVIVVGSGGAGLVAACAAADRGLRVMVLEASSVLGGTTAISGGQMWIPASQPMNRAGFTDSEDDARNYLARVALGVPAERLDSFIDHGAAFVDYLEQELNVPVAAVDRPDYHPGWPGARDGRTLEPLPVNTEALGDWREHVRVSPTRPPTTSTEGRNGIDPEVLAARRAADVRTQGAGLVAGLVAAALRRDVELLADAPVTSLDREGEYWKISTSTGSDYLAGAVVLAAGGFARNPGLRHHLHPLLEILPTAVPGSNGQGLQLGVDAGGHLHGMNEAWWTPATSVPGETIDGAPAYRNVVRELAAPGSIMVNPAGRRFVNEASSYNDLAKAFFAFDTSTHTFPNEHGWLIFDAHFRATRSILSVSPTDPDPDWFRTADTLDGLAVELGIDPPSLTGTIDAFNDDATNGHDSLFGRGDNAHDRFNGVATAPNACLGPILEAPFYGVSIRLGANGTKGGLVTDAAARVLAPDNTPIPGLFAVGENAAALMGPGYAGSGASLGPSLVEAYILAQHLTTP